MTWFDLIFVLIVLIVLIAGGGMIRRHRGRQGYVRYNLAWISVWVVSLVLLIAFWVVIGRQAIH